LKKIAVIGSRTWTDTNVIAKFFDSIKKDGPLIIVSGGAAGAQAEAERIAIEYGMPLIIFKPVKLTGGLKEDSYGVDEWRISGPGESSIVHHHEPTWADYQSALNYRSLLIEERAHEAQAFWDGRSRGTAFEIELFENAKKPCEVTRG
jgi:hypothetical protein